MKAGVLDGDTGGESERLDQGLVVAVNSDQPILSVR